jgi:hypothetical protein
VCGRIIGLKRKGRTMRRFVMLSLLIFGLPFSVAQAAGPFDGTWSGDAVGSGPSASQCTGTMKGSVENNVLRSRITIGRFKPAEVGGPVGADGSFKSPAGRITGQFTGNSFVGSMTVPNGYCNPYKLTMSRS